MAYTKPNEEWIAHYQKAGPILWQTPFGARRRAELLQWFHAGQRLGLNPMSVIVNKTHAPLLDTDPDLRYLLKKGTLVRKREYRSDRCRYTKLVLSASHNRED